MVRVYNCHPFSGQRIVPTEQEPGLVCCGGGALFVLSAGGCKIDVFDPQLEQCPLICRFSTMGLVQSFTYSQIGEFLNPPNISTDVTRGFPPDAPVFFPQLVPI